MASTKATARKPGIFLSGRSIPASRGCRRFPAIRCRRIDPPPGTVWPPLPPSVPEGKVIALVAISGIGYRYTVLTVPPPKPDQGLPPTPEHPITPTPPNPATPAHPIAGQPTPTPTRR